MLPSRPGIVYFSFKIITFWGILYYCVSITRQRKKESMMEDREAQDCFKNSSSSSIFKPYFSKKLMDAHQKGTFLSEMSRFVASYNSIYNPKNKTYFQKHPKVIIFNMTLWNESHLWKMEVPAWLWVLFGLNVYELYCSRELPNVTISSWEENADYWALTLFHNHHSEI